MTDILLVLKSGGEYTAEHVYRLRDQLDTPENLVVYSDIKIEGVRTIPLMHDWQGWWSKMEMFRHESPFLFMDLDTTVRKPLGDLVKEAEQYKFVALRDVYRGIKDPNALQSSLMYTDGSFRWLYDLFKTDPKYYDGGDQIFIEKNVENPMFWQDITDEVTSYKVPNGNEDPTVVIFHGKPRPWEVAA